MFTLRKITGTGVELNFIIGKSYTLITKENNPKEFDEARVKFKHQDDETIGYIFGDDADPNPLVLFKGQQNYIMVGGKTVNTITKM